ncbi:MAG TPA: hypothetical protein VKT78_01120, partial [Fimbriimonadaceae bacterium]|nr:hypothetical protein [Fimbriimonadaceae bacterium]
IADSQFSPDPNRPVIDLRDAERKLALAWATPIKRVGGAEVWDACVGKDGTIWIAVSPGETGGNVTLPTSITTSPRRDYARLHDIQPSWILARGHHFTMDGKAVFVAAFTPLVPNDGAPPNAATVTFARRDPWQSAASTDLGTSEGVSGSPIRLALRPEHAAYPSYFVALDLDRFALELPIDVPHARSVRLEQLGRTLEAARSYEDEARGNEVFVPHHATVPLARAEKLYRSLGMTADAERVRAWSEGVTAAY